MNRIERETFAGLRANDLDGARNFLNEVEDRFAVLPRNVQERYEVAAGDFLEIAQRENDHVVLPEGEGPPMRPPIVVEEPPPFEVVPDIRQPLDLGPGVYEQLMEAGRRAAMQPIIPVDPQPVAADLVAEVADLVPEIVVDAPRVVGEDNLGPVPWGQVALDAIDGVAAAGEAVLGVLGGFCAGLAGALGAGWQAVDNLYRQAGPVEGPVVPGGEAEGEEVNRRVDQQAHLERQIGQFFGPSRYVLITSRSSLIPAASESPITVAAILGGLAWFMYYLHVLGFGVDWQNIVIQFLVMVFCYNLVNAVSVVLNWWFGRVRARFDTRIEVALRWHEFVLGNLLGPLVFDAIFWLTTLLLYACEVKLNTQFGRGSCLVQIVNVTRVATDQFGDVWRDPTGLTVPGHFTDLRSYRCDEVEALIAGVLYVLAIVVHQYLLHARRCVVRDENLSDQLVIERPIPIAADQILDHVYGRDVRPVNMQLTELNFLDPLPCMAHMFRGYRAMFYPRNVGGFGYDPVESLNAIRNFEHRYIHDHLRDVVHMRISYRLLAEMLTARITDPTASFDSLAQRAADFRNTFYRYNMSAIENVQQEDVSNNTLILAWSLIGIRRGITLGDVQSNFRPRDSHAQ